MFIDAAEFDSCSCLRLELMFAYFSELSADASRSTMSELLMVFITIFALGFAVGAMSVLLLLKVKGRNSVAAPALTASGSMGVYVTPEGECYHIDARSRGLALRTSELIRRRACRICCEDSKTA